MRLLSSQCFFLTLITVSFICSIIFQYQFPTVADWRSIARVITQTRDRAFQTFGRAFIFFLSPQRLVQVFQKLD